MTMKIEAESPIFRRGLSRRSPLGRRRKRAYYQIKTVLFLFGLAIICFCYASFRPFSTATHMQAEKKGGK